MDASPLARLRAAFAGRYTLERVLGRGATATVWLARDVKHDRSVALKVLRPEIAAALGTERFLREITVTAGLHHPHILPLLDSGEAAGQLFYVMPNVEGESLRDRLNRERELPLEDALQITREVADALRYAHDHGVVHRDIKPENILLESGHAVVADFGIAKALTTAGGDRLTETGFAVGTPAYMSPEQGLGSKDLDGRSDLYSLGCVLYEMLSGETPYTGPTPQAIIAKKLSEPTPRISVVRAVPESVEAALIKALAKSPVDRFATAGNFIEALSRAPSRRKSRPGRLAALAVAPVIAGGVALAMLLWDQGPTMTNPAYTILADVEGSAAPEVRRAVKGLLRSGLEQASVLMPVGEEEVRTGIARMQRPDTLPLDVDVARELAYRASVRTVVVASLDRIGGAFALVVRVLDAEDGSLVATERATSDTEDDLIPAADRVVNDLHRRLGARRAELEAQRPLLDVTTASFEAYRKYARAWELQERYDYRGALELLREALAIDSGFAAAWALSASTWGNLGRRDSMLVAIAQLERHLDRGTERERLFQATRVAFFRGDYERNLTLWERTMRDYAPRPRDWHNWSFALDMVGRREEGLEAQRRLSTASPFGPTDQQFGNLIATLIRLGRAQEAQALLDSAGSGFTSDRGVYRALIVLAFDDATRTESLAVAGPPFIASFAAAGLAMRRGEIGLAEERFGQLGRNAPGSLEIAVAELLITLVAGRPWPQPPVFTKAKEGLVDGQAWTGVWEAVIGDTLAARAIALAVRDSFPTRYRGASPEFIEAAIAARGARWQEVVDLLGPVADWETGRRQYDAWITPLPIRWLLATAYEQTGRLDSAAAMFERVLGTDMLPPHLLVRAIPYSFAHQRLVVHYARMGRLADATRHWEIIRGAFTKPDPEYAHLVDEAREALEWAARERGVTLR